MSTDLDDGLVRYFAIRERQRANAINRAFATLRPYERRLVVEAAVMAYVRGTMNGRARAALREPREDDPRANLYERALARLGIPTAAEPQTTVQEGQS